MNEATRNFRRQTLRLFRSSLRNRYRGTFVGAFWVLLQPLVQFGLQAYAFKYVVRIEQPDYLIFLLSGLLPWIFIVSSIEMCATTFIYQAPIFKSIVINPIAFIAAQVLDNFLVLVVGLAVGSIALLSLSNVSIYRMGLLAPALFPTFIFAAATALIVATYQVFFRDLKFVVAFAINAVYFVTPILYPIDFVPEGHRWLIELNPLYQIIKPFRSALFAEHPQYLVDLSYAAAIALAFAGLAGFLWRQRANEIVLYV